VGLTNNECFPRLPDPVIISSDTDELTEIDHSIAVLDKDLSELLLQQSLVKPSRSGYSNIVLFWRSVR
jgi:hypothetical protein